MREQNLRHSNVEGFVRWPSCSGSQGENKFFPAKKFFPEKMSTMNGPLSPEDWSVFPQVNDHHITDHIYIFVLAPGKLRITFTAHFINPVELSLNIYSIVLPDLALHIYIFSDTNFNYFVSF